MRGVCFTLKLSLNIRGYTAHVIQLGSSCSQITNIRYSMSMIRVSLTLKLSLNIRGYTVHVIQLGSSCSQITNARYSMSMRGVRFTLSSRLGSFSSSLSLSRQIIYTLHTIRGCGGRSRSARGAISKLNNTLSTCGATSNRESNLIVDCIRCNSDITTGKSKSASSSISRNCRATNFNVTKRILILFSITRGMCSLRMSIRGVPIHTLSRGDMNCSVSSMRIKLSLRGSRSVSRMRVIRTSYCISTTSRSAAIHSRSCSRVSYVSSVLGVSLTIKRSLETSYVSNSMSMDPISLTRRNSFKSVNGILISYNQIAKLFKSVVRLSCTVEQIILNSCTDTICISLSRVKRITSSTGSVISRRIRVSSRPKTLNINLSSRAASIHGNATIRTPSSNRPNTRVTERSARQRQTITSRICSVGISRRNSDLIVCGIRSNCHIGASNKSQSICNSFRSNSGIPNFHVTKRILVLFSVTRGMSSLRMSVSTSPVFTLGRSDMYSSVCCMFVKICLSCSASISWMLMVRTSHCSSSASRCGSIHLRINSRVAHMSTMLTICLTIKGSLETSNISNSMTMGRISLTVQFILKSGNIVDCMSVLSFSLTIPGSLIRACDMNFVIFKMGIDSFHAIYIFFGCDWIKQVYITVRILMSHKVGLFSNRHANSLLYLKKIRAARYGRPPCNVVRYYSTI